MSKKRHATKLVPFELNVLRYYSGIDVSNAVAPGAAFNEATEVLKKRRLIHTIDCKITRDGLALLQAVD